MPSKTKKILHSSRMSELPAKVGSMPEAFSYISLFSSAGLGCFGFKQEGFECVATAELLPRRMEVQKANNIVKDPEGYILGDLSDPSVRKRVTERASRWLETNGQRDITLIVATPPCQGISVANHKKRDNEIVRNSLVVESIRLVSETLPKFFVFENVRSFLTAGCLDTDGQQRSIGDAIQRNLEATYNISGRVVNLKDYGSPSSRTRTLVIGVRRDIPDVRPSEFMPKRAEAPTLRALISTLPRLSEMGAIDSTDIYHGFRRYESRMRPWISNTPEGKSAFSNTQAELRPHRVIDGVRVENKSSNADKYRRPFWDKVAPCVHTRNDILSSQSTVHPNDDRVFSIRELMLMMGVPESFRWAPFHQNELNALPKDKREEFLSEHETNIRQCLGEGVPTPVFTAIAAQIRAFVSEGRPRSVGTPGFAGDFVHQVEFENPRRSELAAYYTRQEVAYQLVSETSRPKPKRGAFRILEPSVGAGAFIPSLIERFGDRDVVLDVLDLDPNALARTKDLVAQLEVPDNFSIRYFEANFLTHDFESSYDLVVGNPPFGRLPRAELPARYAGNSRELFSLFTTRALELGAEVAFVLPKSIIMAPEHDALRERIQAHAVTLIADYGELAFVGVKIETIGLVVNRKLPIFATKVLSLPLRETKSLPQEYVCDEQFPSWLPYRDPYFDLLAKHLRLGAFKAVRDRELSSKHYSERGSIAVFRGRDIPRSVVDGDMSASCFIDKLPRSASGYQGISGAIVAPNLSYFPRARELPSGAVADGSAAVLIPLLAMPTKRQVDFFSSEEFFWFYRVARSYATRSLNIDRISAHFWGLADDELLDNMNTDFRPDSSLLHKRKSVGGAGQSSLISTANSIRT